MHWHHYNATAVQLSNSQKTCLISEFAQQLEEDILRQHRLEYKLQGMVTMVLAHSSVTECRQLSSMASYRAHRL